MAVALLATGVVAGCDPADDPPAGEASGGEARVEAEGPGRAGSGSGADTPRGQAPVPPDSGPVGAAEDSAAAPPPGGPGTGDTASPTPPPTGAPPPGDRDTVAGRIAVAAEGPAAFVFLERDEAPRVALSGPLVEELRRLDRAVVEVEGTPAAGPAREALRVTDYRIVSVNDQPVEVGVVQVEADVVRLVGEERTRVLLDAPEGLRSAAGARVWVSGREEEGGLRVASYGVLRRPGG